VSRRAARLALGLAAAALLVYYLLTPAGIYGSKAQGDGYFSFHYLPNLAVHHSLDMRHALPADLDAMDTGPRGHKVNRAPIGPALAMLPVYCLGESAKLLAVHALRAVGVDARVLGPPPFVPHTGQMLYTGLVTLAAGVLGMLLTYGLLHRYLGRGAAVIGALGAIGLTPQLWYLTQQPHYQHGLAFAAVALFLWTWDRERGQLAPRRYGKLGVLAGVAMLMRAQEAVLLLAPALELLPAIAARSRRGAALRCLIALALGAGLGFLPQLWVWGRYFGWLVRPPNVERMRPLAPALAEVLWSMRAGLFPWTPAAYLGLAGLVLAVAPRPPDAGRTRLRGLAAGALAVLAADVYLVASSWVWYGGYSFGARRLSDCAGLFGLGVAVLWERAQQLTPRWRRLATGLLAGVLAALFVLNATLVELVRQRRLPNPGASAEPAFRLAERSGAPAWLIAALRHGNPFVQPAGALFALRHHAPATAWESVVGNYALEQEAHDLSLSGTTWDFRDPRADRFVIEGLGSDRGDASGRPLAPHVRLLLHTFAATPIEATLDGQLPTGCALSWNDKPLPVDNRETGLRFHIPQPLVAPHAVNELTLDCPHPPRLRQLRLALPGVAASPAPPRPAHGKVPVTNNRISVISSIALRIPSRPSPDSLTPPNGM
jgi:hypothetical protein